MKKRNNALGAILMCILYLAAAGGALAIECAPQKPVQINVVPVTKDIEHDFSMKLADIQGYAMDTVNPYSFHSATYTQGFMKGAIRMVPSIKMSGFTLPDQGVACLWYNTIDINIEIDPKIVIAKEIHEDPCTHHSVLGHEMKHVYADRKIVNKYSEIMGKKVYDALQYYGFKAGPIPVAHKEKVAKRMQDIVFDVIKSEYANMEADRRAAQDAIDTLEEYERVSAMCPDSQKKLLDNPNVTIPYRTRAP